MVQSTTPHHSSSNLDSITDRVKNRFSKGATSQPVILVESRKLKYWKSNSVFALILMSLECLLLMSSKCLHIPFTSRYCEVVKDQKFLNKQRGLESKKAKAKLQKLLVERTLFSRGLYMKPIIIILGLALI